MKEASATSWPRRRRRRRQENVAIGPDRKSKIRGYFEKRNVLLNAVRQQLQTRGHSQRRTANSIA